MPDYPVLYLTPISVHMAYIYLVIVSFRLIYSPFNSTTLFACGRGTAHLGATWLEGGS